MVLPDSWGFCMASVRMTSYKNIERKSESYFRIKFFPELGLELWLAWDTNWSYVLAINSIL
jgi:hypothetical protein